MSLADWVKDATQQNENQIIQLRQHIHEYPELGNMEFKTSALIQKIKVLWHSSQNRLCKNRVIGILKGVTLALLLRLEQIWMRYLWKKSGVPFASKQKQFIKVKKLM